MDFRVYGPSPLGPHLTNLLLHLLNGCLLFAVTHACTWYGLFAAMRLAGHLPALLLGIARTVLVVPLLTGAPKMHTSDIELLLRFFLHGASNNRIAGNTVENTAGMGIGSNGTIAWASPVAGNYAVQVNRLAVRILDTQGGGKPRPVLNISAIYEGELEDLPDMVPYLARAAFQDFPGRNGRVQVVRVNADSPAHSAGSVRPAGSGEGRELKIRRLYQEARELQGKAARVRDAKDG